MDGIYQKALLALYKKMGAMTSAAMAALNTVGDVYHGIYIADKCSRVEYIKKKYNEFNSKTDGIRMCMRSKIVDLWISCLNASSVRELKDLCNTGRSLHKDLLKRANRMARAIDLIEEGFEVSNPAMIKGAIDLYIGQYTDQDVLQAVKIIRHYAKI